jgi:diguanylate cyclase (GGDEF)-like protein
MAAITERSIRPLAMDELENSVLLRGVDLQSLQGLLKESPLMELERLEVLIEANQSNRFLYLLLEGRLSIRLKLTLDAMAMIGPGEFVGELAVLDGQPTSAYVIANTDCRLLALEEQALWSLIHSCPTVARNLLFVVSKRLQRGNSLILSGPQLERQYTDFTVLDALTGVYNHSWLEKMLPRKIERSEKALTLLLIQIDDFKTYKEQHGDQAGGYALYTVARTIRAWLEPDEIIARCGQEQFMVLLPGTAADTARKIATHLRHLISISEVVTLENDVHPPANISVGVAQMRRGDSPARLIAAAERSLSDVVFQDLVKRMELEPAARAEKRHELNAKVAESKMTHEVAVLEVLKIFQKPMSVGKIANELVAIRWDFENHHPRIVVYEAIKKLLGKGVEERIRGDYTVAR